MILSSPSIRPLRFAGTGMAAGTFQLALLFAFVHIGWHALAANVAAFLLAAQVNFALSSALTWRDRQPSRALWRRWLLFHGSIATMALVNMLVFLLARAVVPTLVASMLGIAAGAAGNYFAGDRLVFRQTASAPVMIERSAA